MNPMPTVHSFEHKNTSNRQHMNLCIYENFNKCKHKLLKKENMRRRYIDPNKLIDCSWIHNNRSCSENGRRERLRIRDMEIHFKIRV